MKPKSTKARVRKRRSAASPRQAIVSRKSSRGGPFYGYHANVRRMATLAEVLDPNTPTNSLGELDHSEMIKLVVARLRADKHFIPLFMLGARGVIDKKRAIREVLKGSPIGLHLMEIEKEYIHLQVAGRQ